MADETYLNDLLAQQTEPVARSLVEEFAKMIRDPSIGTADPARLRQVMDVLFKGLTNAPAEPDSP
jgi:hypothetical protein